MVRFLLFREPPIARETFKRSSWVKEKLVKEAPG
tara:strand:- start:149 stop:250 length:102 start_codon:yes stop_codon:yes gene_type:complete